MELEVDFPDERMHEKGKYSISVHPLLHRLKISNTYAIAYVHGEQSLRYFSDFSEILRVLDSLQLTDKAKVATPVDWKMGDDCMVLPTVPEENIDTLFPQGVTVVSLPSGKKYLKKTPCPDV
ncbi:Peroxiredoxin-6 [Papilio xuthus]|uniref:Peroxiredoxin-6 n=1 Tax=Papilio xuthus TaxID=66420 RepID=A0A194PGM2_PAPXU|nr:Peroxiredoxin-6 [Papilio xuthus]